MRAVAVFRGGVFPHLTEHHGILFLLFGRAVHQRKHIVGELIRHIEAVSSRALFKPAAHHAVVIGDDEALPVRIVLVDLGQRFKPPPAFVFIGVMLKRVPRVIRRRLAVGRAAALVSFLAVKINAVAARMREDAVEHDADAERFRFIAQRHEVVLTSEHRIDLFVIRRVVAVVGRCLEYRV